MVGHIAILLALALSAIDFNRGSVELRHLPFDANNWTPAFRDSDGNYWWHEPDADRIWRWDGRTYKPFEFGSEARFKVAMKFEEDPETRLWLVHQRANLEAFVFNRETGEFTHYQTLLKAITSELSQHPDLDLFQNKWLQMKFIVRNGKAALMEPRRQILYHDGKKWHTFPRNMFTQEKYRREENIDLQQDGQLIFNTYKMEEWNVGKQIQWTYGLDKKWNSVTNQYKYTPKPFNLAPKEMGWKHYSQFSQDPQGDFWMVDNTNLYRHAFGITVEFAKLPLKLLTRVGDYPAQLIDIQIDPFGNRIFRINNHYCTPRINSVFTAVMGENPPKVQINYSGTSDYESCFNFIPSKGYCTFVWRLDGTDWSKPTHSSILKLEGLPPGNHHLEVMAIDQKLNRHDVPASVNFAIEGILESQNKKLVETTAHENVELANRAKRILTSREYGFEKESACIIIRRDFENLVQQLKSNDYEERNNAALILSNGDAEIQGQLEKLLEGANDDFAWWLKVTLQQMNP